MNINSFVENIWRVYQSGRANATRQDLTEADILQMVKMGYARRMRELYYANKKLNEGDEFYFYSGILSIKRFKLSDPDRSGKRIANMSDVDLYRLPKNMDTVTVYPVGCSGSDGTEEITQIQPGEEVFYVDNPDLVFFKFLRYKSKAIVTWHLPPCVTSIDVESTFDDAEIDIPLDICSDLEGEILGIALHVPGFAGKNIDNSFDPARIEQPRRQAQIPQTGE